MKTLEQISERWQTEVEPCRDMCKAYYDITWLLKAVEKQQRQIEQMRDCRNCANLSATQWSISSAKCSECQPSTLSQWEWEVPDGK